MKDFASRYAAFRSAVDSRVLIADGAMGTMLQSANVSIDDFEGHEGCNEVLNRTRPDVVGEIHAEYLKVGVDAVETNTFGANLANLGEYGISDQIYELNRAGAEVAVAAARSFGESRFVIGSIGPGTKLPTLGHVTYRELRDAYEVQAAGLIEGGADCLLIETSQDLLQTRAAINGIRAAKKTLGLDTPIWAQVTVETTGTMLLGSEIGAALTALSPLQIDGIGLNCATGPAEMSEHLRFLAQNSTIRISAMPNAGLPVVTSSGATYPLSPVDLAAALDDFVERYSLNLIGGCCGTTPAHLSAVVQRLHGRAIRPREVTPVAAVSSIYSSVPLRQETAFLSIGERANTNGSKAFREAMIDSRLDDCVEIGRSQVREGAHVMDLCVDYVGRDGTADMSVLAGLFATSSTLPLMLDSTEPEVLRAGLEKLGGRSIVNSVNFEDGDGEGSRFQRTMDAVVEHGAAVVALAIDETGQARTVERKLEVAERLIATLTNEWNMQPEDILLDLLTFPVVTGQEEMREDGKATIEAIRQLKLKHPRINTVLGLSNISFGVKPAARQVLNSVFLHECLQVGLDSAILHAGRIVPISRIDENRVTAAVNLLFDRRDLDSDPLGTFLNLFQDDDATSARTADPLAGLELFDRIEIRVIEALPKGLSEDLALALSQMPAIDIVNVHLLAAMKEVGERFGRGDMQLPFVLQSAEVMKQAVAILEPHLEKSDSQGKGTIVLATVKGDVHDIGKNLVDIILTNNGYRVVNIGIKQPVNAIIESALAENADAIGMSGLLVKSTLVMKDNLEEIDARGLGERFPVILGGAALTRSFVEEDLNDIYRGEVRYAKDAFEGLALMDAIMAVKRGVEGAHLPEPRKRVTARTTEHTDSIVVMSDVAKDNIVPPMPFSGSKVVKGISLAEISSFLDLRSLFVGQWGLKPGRSQDSKTLEELIDEEGQPRLRYWLDRATAEGIFEPAVLYGYFKATAEGNQIQIANTDGTIEQFEFPRQVGGRHLCLADYVHEANDQVAFHVVTMGQKVSEVTARLFEQGEYREYLELHGLSVALTEALAEYWHSRIREEWGISQHDSADLSGILKQQYQGERFSFGYPACPDLSLQDQLDRLLDFSKIGVTLSEEWQLHPEQSTSAIIFHHPEAAYFNATN